ncbi:MAG: Rrf2 family transcriptional regulator [Bacteroidia bacterium]|nr:Rrf2 family transcriptional regulator [Bacteroidia bacterium]
MKFNTRIRYGLRAILEIALDESESGVFQKDIAKRQKISVKYLDNIIAALKTSGLIVNKRGRKSGYILSRKPVDIKILDIHNAFEPGFVIVDCLSGNYVCDLSKQCCVRDFWLGLNNVIINYFESYTLEDLIKEHRSKSS